ncbi:MAG TPA: glycosyltransferase 87 family protein [Blastocatellia bacterium]|nr:glycosyltransferase 87 family protein [Blastocatellia bacterium]
MKRDKETGRWGEGETANRPLRLLIIALIASEALYLAVLRFNATNGLRPVVTFLGILAALFAIYGASALVVQNTRERRGVLFIIAAGAVLFRLTLLPAGLPPDAGWRGMPEGLRADVRGEAVAYERFQLYDDDIWRYLWDGHMQAKGINPYLYAPADGKLDELTNGSEKWGAIRDNINYADTPTIYPPLAQLVFRFAHYLAPGSVLVMKSVAVFFDLLAALLLALVLQATGRRVSLVVLYAWNPLVIKVFAASGHVDAVLVAALAATSYFIIRRDHKLSAISFGLAILAKLSPVVLLPFVMKRAGWRYALLTGALVIAGYLPFIGAGGAMFAGFRQFAREWQFNAGPYALIEWCAGFLSGDPAAAARAMGGLMIIAFIAWLIRRDDGKCETFAHYAALALGALLLLGPALMPWYVTWLLPLAVVANQRVWLYFSALVCLAFLVMIDETERAPVLWLEYGALALLGLKSRPVARRQAAKFVTTESTA